MNGNAKLSARIVHSSAGHHIVRACDSLMTVLPTLKKQVDAEISFAKGQAQKIKGLGDIAQDSVVT